MKLSMSAFIVALGLLASVPQSARAFQDDTSTSQAQARKWPTPEEVVAKLDSRLSLSADQKARITPIIADRQQRLRAAATDQSGRRWKKAREMKSIYKDSDAKIEAVLTGDQKKKYEDTEKEMRAEMKERRQQRANRQSQ